METHLGCATVLITHFSIIKVINAASRSFVQLKKLALHWLVQSQNVPLMPYDGCKVL